MPVSKPATESILAAIDVGTNAVRLELAKVQLDGSLESLHQERDPVRPGEGLFRTGFISREVADRLLATLRRYGALCRRYGARVRAVATSSLREAKNRDEIVRRVQREAGFQLEVISGREEARLVCLGVLQGRSSRSRSLCIDIGGGSTEVALAAGDVPQKLWSVDLGAVRLTETFEATGRLRPRELNLLREYAREVVRKGLPPRISPRIHQALGSSGTIQAVVGFADGDGSLRASRRAISHAVEELAEMSPQRRRKRFDRRRADIVVAGAVILEAVMRQLGVEAVAAVQRGLREGLLADLLRRSQTRGDAPSVAEAALELGRWYHFDEPHALQVRRLALELFDALAAVHQLPAAARPYLEAAALLHDVGKAVSYPRHHKHSQYLIQNADLPGLTDQDRDLIGRIARFHRRSWPDLGHAGMEGTTPSEARLVRKCAALLRLADALDAGHHQLVRRIRVESARTVTLRLGSRGHLDLELWDAQREAELFHTVFGRRLALIATRR